MIAIPGYQTLAQIYENAQVTEISAKRQDSQNRYPQFLARPPRQ